MPANLLICKYLLFGSPGHRADIVAAVRKAGWSLRSLSLHHGYASPNTVGIALHRHWPKGERLIATAIGVEAATIWPTRYRHKNSPEYKKKQRRGGA